MGANTAHKQWVFHAQAATFSFEWSYRAGSLHKHSGAGIHCPIKAPDTWRESIQWSQTPVTTETEISQFTHRTEAFAPQFTDTAKKLSLMENWMSHKLVLTEMPNLTLSRKIQSCWETRNCKKAKMLQKKTPQTCESTKKSKNKRLSGALDKFNYVRVHPTYSRALKMKGCGAGRGRREPDMPSSFEFCYQTVTLHPTLLIQIHFSHSREHFPLYLQIAWFYFFKTLPCACAFNALANTLIVLQDTKHAQIISVAKPAVITSRDS